MSSSKLLAGIASGFLVGLTMGFLTAPAKGSETRRKVLDSAEKFKNKLIKIGDLDESELDDLRDYFENKVENIPDEIRETVLKLIHSSESSYKNYEDEAWGF